VSRILYGLAPWPADSCEVLVFDDSPKDEVAQAVQAFNASHASQGCRVDYRHNHPALGAVTTWNALLDAAKGRHVWLLHHDEFPVGADFVPRLLQRLAADPDVVVLDCLLVDAPSGRNRRHLPMTLRTAVARHAPDYLLRRNVIGPTSALVVRRTIYPRFQRALQWKVDVEAYARLFASLSGAVLAAPDLAIGSLLNRSASITATLKDGLAQRERDEHRWMREQQGLQTPWLADPRTGPLATRLRLQIENLAWLSWRALSRLPAVLGWSARPTAELRRALSAAAARGDRPA
jgi:hypothetical protein